MRDYFYKPLKLEHNRVWRPFIGGKLLDEWQLENRPEDGNFPEEWVASAVNSRNNKTKKNEGLSKVKIEDGEYIFLRDIILKNPSKYIGETLVKTLGTDLPILVKVLDSYTRLLIQVHPTKEYAKRIFNSKYGKTEAWYIIGGREVEDEKPYVLLGFKVGVTRETWKDLFEKQDIKAMEDALHKFYVKEGDVFYIEGGVPHAAGSGCFFIEIQEPTDYTFRVERKAPWGLEISDENIHQGVGIENMLNCFNYTTYTREEILNKFYIKSDIEEEDQRSKKTSIIPKNYSPYFSMSRIEINEFFNLDESESFMVAVVISGEGKLIFEGNEMHIKAADEIFIPARLKNLVMVNTCDIKLDVILCNPPLITI